MLNIDNVLGTMSETPTPTPLLIPHSQLFFSFHPSDAHSSITHLHGALQQISSWMISNLLTFNSSKTEFLFIGLKQQLAKLHL